MKHFAKVNQDGKLELLSKDLFLKEVANYKGQEVTLEIKLAKKVRTPQQNKRYWKVIIPYLTDLFNEQGNTFDVSDTHQFCKDRFLEPESKKLSLRGETIDVEIETTTTTLSTQEFIDYENKIIAWTESFFDVVFPL